jgi:hypothetical protein
MKRKAVLIESSNVKGQKEIPGARVDVQNWKAFLKSDLGGAWTDAEIVVLAKPFSEDVARELKVDSDSYCFVAFSGHGCEGSVVLNDYWSNWPVSSLKPTSKRGTVIIDACRGVAEARKISIANERMIRAYDAGRLGEATLNASNAAEVALNRLSITGKHLLRWNNSMDSSSAGIVEMLGCSKGEGAAEDPFAGGYYTSLLVQSAELWEETKSTARIQTTKEAHDYAAHELPVQQKPEYSPLWLAFPFAVKG